MPRKNRQIPTKRQPITAPDCANKRRFPSQLAAERQADLQMLEQPSLTLAVYQCPQCQKWHLTSSRTAE